MEVAQLWGQVTNNPSMNYEKLAMGLRYYFMKGIMSKAPGKRLTFRYAGSTCLYTELQWNPSITDTTGTKVFVLYSEVSFARGRGGDC